jgi:hypothetical protein
VFFWLFAGVVLGVLLMAFPESNFEGTVMQLLMKDRQRGTQ